MINLKDLFTSPSFHYNRIQGELNHLLNKYIEKEGAQGRKELMDKLEIKKSYLSKLLNFGSDFKLSNHIKIAMAIGVVPVMLYLTPEEFMEAEREKRGLESLKLKERFELPVGNLLCDSEFITMDPEDQKKHNYKALQRNDEFASFKPQLKS